MEPSTTDQNSWAIRIDLNIPAQDIADMLTTALEGGIEYWGRAEMPKNTRTKRRYLSDALGLDRHPLVIVESIDEGPEPRHILDKDALIQGLTKYIARYGWPANLGDLDAEQADIIVQLSIFGEVVYG
ncbi:MAG: hypothetical protein M0Z47_00150 [Actinomycetota bacterium]|nr:hypothetical protein [Actinomycetota bacterium]